MESSSGRQGDDSRLPSSCYWLGCGVLALPPAAVLSPPFGVAFDAAAAVVEVGLRWAEGGSSLFDDRLGVWEDSDEAGGYVDGCVLACCCLLVVVAGLLLTNAALRSASRLCK